MRVLIACEFSGTVRKEFEALGHEAWSCDLLPSDVPGNHYQGDVRDMLTEHWDLMIAHPPCTRLCNSGVCWLERRNLWDDMREGAEFFKMLLNAPIERIAVENPIMHKYAREIIGVKYSQIIQPWQFGHGETKATCLWLKNLPLLQPTNIVEGREQRLHKLPPRLIGGAKEAKHLLASLRQWRNSGVLWLSNIALVDWLRRDSIGSRGATRQPLTLAVRWHL